MLVVGLQMENFIEIAKLVVSIKTVWNTADVAMSPIKFHHNLICHGYGYTQYVKFGTHPYLKDAQRRLPLTM